MIPWMWKVRDCLYSKLIIIRRLFGLWNFRDVHNSQQFTNFISLSILEAFQLESSDSLSYDYLVRFCYKHPTSSNSHLSSYYEIVVKSLSPAVGQLGGLHFQSGKDAGSSWGPCCLHADWNLRQLLFSSFKTQGHNLLIQESATMALGSRSRYQGVTAPELAVEIAVSEARKSLCRTHN